ncbi:hypothetical protein SISSUDRAFT_800120 [Sistotremastrum suecicum HHB10207 ss-3]|uniref:Virilizer N-terminal domain-containing protein n=1 Tax=Sistotremastrum suecicum HHB10207 ss-3 TaxID=1314776 RepID=A0A166HQW8_9AGAM|nr:hypothetical protein SISSUDRAFT_800120 [Sistotremastrum suecicum HHB10207 ss-3]
MTNPSTPSTSLLAWETLQHPAKGDVAAIRFAEPVRVLAIRIFPTGSTPFTNAPEIIAQTEPSNFFLQIYFTAQTVAVNSSERPKTSNVLSPTSLAYDGGETEYPLDWNAELSTRLMIIKGDFSSLSLAVYGNPVSESNNSSAISVPTPQTLDALSPPSHNPVLDPANSTDPCFLAKELLNLIPRAPRLDKVVRFIFCLKPSKEDWSRPNFPLYANWDQLPFDFEEAIILLSRPLPADTPKDAISNIARKIKEIVAPLPLPWDTRFLTLLSHVARQDSTLLTQLFDELNPPETADPNSVPTDEDIQLMYTAVANPSLARILDRDSWRNSILDVIQNPVTSSSQDACTLLRERILGQRAFDKLSLDGINEQHLIFDWLWNIGSREQSLGIWLSAIIEDTSFSSACADINGIASPEPLKPLVYYKNGLEATNRELLSLVRAFIGVASCLAAFAWADSLPDKHCRARLIKVFRLWQQMDGYSEILQHLLSLTQFMVRFERILERNERPDAECMDVEQIMLTMIQDPNNLLNSDVVYTAQALPDILQSIPSEIRIQIGKQLEIVDPDADAQEAVTTLVQWTGPSSDLSHLTLLAASLAKINEILEEKPDQEYTILQLFWSQGSQGMVSRLAEVFTLLLDAVPLHDPLKLTGSLNSPLLYAFTQLLGVIEHFVHMKPVPFRSLRSLVDSIVNLYALCAPLGIWQNCDKNGYLTSIRQRTLSVMSVLCVGNDVPNLDHDIAAAVLRELMDLDSISSAFDPIARLEATLEIMFHIFKPLDSNNGGHTIVESWNQEVLPDILPSLSAFLHILPPSRKADLIHLFSERDHGQLGTMEWLISQEINELSHTLHIYRSDTDLQRRILCCQEIDACYRFLLMVSNDETRLWASSSGLTALGLLLCDSLSSLSECRIACSSAARLALTLMVQAHLLPNRAQSDFTKILFQAACIQPLLVSDFRPLYSGSSQSLTSAVHEDIRAFIFSLRHDPSISEKVNPEFAEAFILTLDWIFAGGFRFSPSDIVPLQQLLEAMKPTLTASSLQTMASLDLPGRADTAMDVQDSVLPSVVDPEPSFTLQDLQTFLTPSLVYPATPPRHGIQGVFETNSISPPTAILRSPLSSLTKTYAGDSFRQPRQVSNRQNSSRLPSLHVDVGINSQITL